MTCVAAVFGAPGGLCELVHAVTPEAGIHVWDGDPQSLPSEVTLVLVHDQQDPPRDAVRVLSALSDSRPDLPAVAIVPFSRATATALAVVAFEEVVWADDVGQLLPPLLRKHSNGTLAGRLAACLSSRVGHDRTLSRAVNRAFGPPPPLTSVADLAACVHVSPSRLRARWRGSRLPGTPKCLLNWAMLVRAAEARGRRGLKVEVVARRAGVHPTTLLRASSRLVGVPPAELSEETVLSAFSMWASSA